MDKHSFNSNLPYAGRYNNTSYSQNYNRPSYNFDSPFQSQSGFSNDSESNLLFQKSDSNFSPQRSVWNTNSNNSIPSLFSQNAAWQGNQNSLSGNNPAWISNRNNDSAPHWMGHSESWNARTNFQNNSRNNYRGGWRRSNKPEPKPAKRNETKNVRSEKDAQVSSQKDTAEANTSAWRRKRKRSRPNKPAQGSPDAKKIKSEPDSAVPSKSDGILVTVTMAEFPLKRLATEENDKLLEQFNALYEKLDSEGAFIKSVQKKKGSLFITCKDEKGVQLVKTIVNDLSPWEGIKLRVIVPVDRDSKKWIAIVPSDFPSNWFTADERQLLESALEKHLNSIEEDAFHPEFLDYYKRRGSMLLACNNDLTVNWLRETVPELKAFEGEQPRTVDANELPCYFKIEFLLPTTLDKLDLMMERLNRQNEGVNTKSWYIIRQTESEKGISVIVSVDIDVYNHLKQVKMKLFLNFGIVEFKYLGILKGPYNNKQIEGTEKENGTKIKQESS
jgi:hypothetical protein